MSLGNRDRLSPLLFRALAGVETGVLGAASMFGWLTAASILDGRPVWAVYNLLGSVFYGQEVLRRGFNRVTLAGLALHFFAAGLIGLFFGVAMGGSASRRRVALSGILTGIVWYYFSERLFWRKLGALAMLYSPPVLLLPGYLVFGLVLAWFPRRLRGLGDSLSGEPVPPVTHVVAASAPAQE